MSLRLRLFLTCAFAVIVSLVVIAISMTLLMRNYVDRQTFSRLDDMARPIYVQIVGLIRGNVTPLQLLNNLQEQSDKNGSYMLLIDGSGNIVRQIMPLQPQSLSPVEVAPGTLPQSITALLKGSFTSIDGRVFLYSAYPIARQSDQLNQAEILALVIPRPGTLSVLMTFIWPFFIAAGISLIVSLLISILLARSIYSPLAAVKKAAQQISRGDYTQRIQLNGPREVKELAETFNRMTEDVEQAQLRLRHFVADVSHELRSPLTSIHGFAQALLDGTAADEATRNKAAQIIFDESKRLKNQVDELLQLSRMQSNQAKSPREPVNLKEVLEHCVEVFTVQAKEKMVEIELKAEPDIIVSGDPDRLEQVFNNLIDNSVKNSPSGGKVLIQSNRADGNLSRTSVSDDGPGIPPDYLPRVFDRFYQVTGVRTGVGLGLAIAKEIVTAHNGTIEATSMPGEGARFTVTLPLKTD